MKYGGTDATYVWYQIQVPHFVYLALHLTTDNSAS